ncbi:ABC transporter substrate-binding protein [Rhodobacteraceae bacterium NNCM2]|nr:ABC transporter substrate-binding protein [Coraliihabitans acroporae]
MSESNSRVGITRRGLLQTGAAGALMVGLDGMPLRAAAPKPGGTLRVGMGHGQTADSLDPGKSENAFTAGLCFSYNNFLTEVAPNGTLAPELAETWEASEDASSWTFKLVKANFHDGSPVTAKDVVASMNHHRGEDSQSAAKPILAPVKDVVAIGTDAVRFDLESGNADFPFIVSDYHLPIMPANDDGTMNWQAGIGAGPFMLENFEPGVRAELKRFDGYWKGNVNLDKLELLSIVDSVARTNALMTGSVDVIDRVDLKTVALLKRNPNVVIATNAGTEHYTFPMRCNTAPFDDNNVRMALKYGVKREELLEKVLQGYGAVGNDLPIGPNQRFFNKDLPQRNFDPDKSKYYLKQSGLDSIDVTLQVSEAAFAGATDAAQLFAASAAEGGVNISVKREPNDGYWSNVWNKDPFCACYWSGRPVEDQMFSTAYESGVPWNDTAWSNERFDELLVKARAELNNDLRREMYYEMQEILHNDGGVIIPMFASYVTARNKNVGVPELTASNWSLDGHRFGERWWMN